MKKIIARVKELPPHEIRKTVCLNQARMIVTYLSKPLAENLQAIEKTKTEGEQAQTLLKAQDYKDKDYKDLPSLPKSYKVVISS